jgi:hypothetical protein
VTEDPRDPFQPAPVDPGRRTFAPTDGAPARQPTPVEPVVVRPRRSGAGMLVNVLLGLALVVAVGGVAFAAGRATAPASANAAGRTGLGQGGQGFNGPAASGAPGRGQGFGGAGGAGGLGGAVSVQGTVEAIDGSSMTIKLPSGTTVTIGLNGDTTYHTQAAATASDVTSGSTVIVQLQGRGFPGGGQPTASGAPAPSGAPAAGLGTAGSVTVVPPAS